MDRVKKRKRFVTGAAALAVVGWLLAGGALVYAVVASQDSRRSIVETGQAAIRNGCEFDNRRAAELKRNLTLFLEDHIQLHRHVENNGRHTDGPVTIRHTNIEEIAASIGALTTRDCDAAAATLDDE